MRFLHDATPTELARRFWDLDNFGQAEFFAEIGAAIDLTNDAMPSGGIGRNGEKQWQHLAEVLYGATEYERSRHVLMAMAAPLYLHTIRENQENVRAARRLAQKLYQRYVP